MKGLRSAGRAGRVAFSAPSRHALIVRATTLVGGKSRKAPAFPFVKVAGQEEMKLGLLLNVVDPNIGGVLIMGDRGTAKSITVSSSGSPAPSKERAGPWSFMCFTESATLCTRTHTSSPPPYACAHTCLPTCAQVRALVDLLPEIDIVEGDFCNSHPTDPKLMGPYALDKFRKGEKLPASKMRTPLVSLRVQLLHVGARAHTRTRALFA